MRDGIDIAARYMDVHNPALTISLAPMPRTPRDFLSASLKPKNQKRREQNDERTISLMHVTLSALGDAKYTPHEVWFMHEPISPLLTYWKMFGVTPMFGQPTMGIAIERELLDRWRPGGSSPMRDIAETYLHSQSERGEKEFTQRVTTMARSLLTGRVCTPEKTAQALGLHARTLQRRLKEEGSSFEKIRTMCGVNGRSRCWCNARCRCRRSRRCWIMRTARLSRAAAAAGLARRRARIARG
jgi:hypothetical protein